MQASWCPKLPVHNKRFCLFVWSFLTVYFWLLYWKQQSRVPCRGWRLALLDGAAGKLQGEKLSPFRSSWNRTLMSSLLSPNLAWSPSLLQIQIPSAYQLGSCSCPSPGHMTLVSWSISNHGISQPGLYEHSWPRGWLPVELLCQIWGRVNFDRKVVTSSGRTWGEGGNHDSLFSLHQLQLAQHVKLQPEQFGSAYKLC